MQKENLLMCFPGAIYLFLNQFMVVVLSYFLGKSGYGDYKVAVFAMLLLAFLCANGANIIFPKYLKYYLSSKQHDNLAPLFSWSKKHILKSFYGLSISIILCIAALFPFWDIFEHPIILSCIFFPINCLYIIGIASLYSLEEYNLSNFLNSAGLHLIMGLFLLIPFYSGIHITSWIILSFFVTALAIISIICSVVASKKFQSLIHNKSNKENPELWQTGSNAYLFSTIVNKVLPGLLPIYIAEYFFNNEHEVGTYAIIIGIGLSGCMFSRALIKKCTLNAFDFFSCHDRDSLTTFQKSFRDLMLIVSCLAASVFFFSNTLAHFYFHQETIPLDIDLIRIIAFSIPLFVLFSICSMLYSMLAAHKEVFLNSVFYTISIIFFSSLLSYYFGLTGLVFSAIISMSISLCYFFIFFFKKYQQIKRSL